jgi:tryptophan halogenase
MAHDAGWQWRIPLQSRVGNGIVYCSRYLDQEAAMERLLGNIEGEVLTKPNVLRFGAGMRQKQWHRNCVAVGLSGGFMEPLESTSIHLVQSAVGRLLNLLPGDLRDSDSARDNFNRLSAIEWARVRDFIVLHYFANNREGEFWEACRDMGPPDSLLGKIELFREAGLFMREEDELFLDENWGQVMIGQGIMPESWSPLADNVPGEDIGPFLETLAKSYQLKAQALPTHRQFVASMVAGGVKERQS